MASSEREPKTERLSFRVSESQRRLITEAADLTEEDVTSFVLGSATSNAQRVLAERRIFDLAPDSWERWLEVLDRPVTPLSAKPRLEELLRAPSVLEA